MVDYFRLKAASVFLDISEEWISKFSPTMVDIFRLKTVLLDISKEWISKNNHSRGILSPTLFPWPLRGLVNSVQSQPAYGTIFRAFFIFFGQLHLCPPRNLWPVRLCPGVWITLYLEDENMRERILAIIAMFPKDDCFCADVHYSCLRPSQS